jgi:hypothetical protein
MNFMATPTANYVLAVEIIINIVIVGVLEFLPIVPSGNKENFSSVKDFV